MLDPTESQAGRVQSLGFTVEREVGWASVVRAEYVCKLAHGIPNQLAQYNHLDTKYLSLGNLLTATLQRRVRPISRSLTQDLMDQCSRHYGLFRSFRTLLRQT
jgi:hypothetical protein